MKHVKKLMVIMMMAVLGIGGIMAVPGEKASAYSGSKYVDVDGVTHRITVSDDASNVYVKLVQTEFSYELYNWKMELQRANSNDAWVTIGTRHGYVSYDSSSSRTFTSVLKNGSPMMVRITFYDPYTGSVVDQETSNIWIR